MIQWSFKQPFATVGHLYQSNLARSIQLESGKYYTGIKWLEVANTWDNYVSYDRKKFYCSGPRGHAAVYFRGWFATLRSQCLPYTFAVNQEAGIFKKILKSKRKNEWNGKIELKNDLSVKPVFWLADQDMLKKFAKTVI
jgi:hypothetical protein